MNSVQDHLELENMMCDFLSILLILLRLQSVRSLSWSSYEARAFASNSSCSKQGLDCFRQERNLGIYGQKLVCGNGLMLSIWCKRMCSSLTVWQAHIFGSQLKRLSNLAQLVHIFIWSLKTNCAFFPFNGDMYRSQLWNHGRIDRPLLKRPIPDWSHPRCTNWRGVA